MSTEKARVLFVDDEPDLLRSMRLILRRHFKVDTAESGAQALECMANNPAYAVVVSDMRMPNMNGAKFLAAARDLAPHTTRILLTGETDVRSAIDAVNEGAIFRFLTKPCSSTDVLDNLTAAVEQHRLVRAEQDLLQKTLRGSVGMLTEILGHVHPLAFSRSSRVHKVVQHMCTNLEVQDTWAFEIAGMLAHIGLVIIPAETVERDCAGADMEAWEKDLIAKHSDVGAKMLEQVPRLEDVAQMVARQTTGLVDFPDGEPSTWEAIILGGELLRTASVFERSLVSAGNAEDAYAGVQATQPEIHPAILASLEGFCLGSKDLSAAAVMIDKLAPGMVVDQDVRTANGGMLAAKGQVVDAIFIDRLRNFDRRVGVEQPISVLAPAIDIPKKRSA